MDKVEQGKKNRASGGAFERKVRADLESKGWIVAKWTNNVEMIDNPDKNKSIKVGEVDAVTLVFYPPRVGRIIPARHKWRGPGLPLVIGTGFPDFICFKEPYNQTLMGVNFHNITSEIIDVEPVFLKPYVIIGVEAKSNGCLSKEEKEKCKWYIQNNIFSKIYVAKKGVKRGDIIYNEFE